MKTMMMQRRGCSCFGWITWETLPCHKMKRLTSCNMNSSYKESVVYSTKDRWKDIRYRQGNWQDWWVIFSALWSEKMNIMGAFTPHYFLFAYQPKDHFQILGFAQMKPLNKCARKLASVYVYTEYRSNGIGSAIINELLEREKTSLVGFNVVVGIYLTCLSRAESFYNKFGFMKIPADDSSIPWSMKLEYYLGCAVIKLIEPNEQVLIMRCLCPKD
ncbi:hypothetical protein GpartN1_g3766.t1 [Galdieria partita]|uniref:N-acetyltransferase domain-containing protein n=1 Tax=Galdieria partita TaxID=83374 RepID=A0A9C7PX13_9RHOD|nr:hypothetical protein GpartN1_g3766.t1 [Galdieria partita]